MYKWVTRAAILTGTLGLIGVVLIILNTIIVDTNSADKKGTLTGEVKLSAASTMTLPVKVLKTKAKPAIVTKPAKERKDEPIAKKTEANVEKIKKEVTKEPTVKRVNNQRQKRLVQEDLQDLADAINTLKTRTGNNSRCVHLRKMDSEINDLAFQQVEAYLSSKRFNINGRETGENARDGINISAAGKCIIVTVGDF